MAVSLAAVRMIGIAVVISLLVAGQLFISVRADGLAWFDVLKIGLTPGRCTGLVLVAVGTLLIMRP